MVRSKRSFCSAFSVFLSMAIFMSVFTGIPIRFYRQKQYTIDEVISFSESVSDFSAKYDNYEDKIAENPSNIGLSTKRLIVKTDSELISNHSIDNIFGLGYQIFQYADNESMNKDKELLSSKGYNFCEDGIVSANDFISSATDCGNDDMWSYEHLGIRENIERYQNDTYDEIVVGVIDSGIESTHELFNNRIIPNNFNFSSSGKANDSSDDDGHGTSVSGVIAMSTPDNVKIKPYKFLNCLGKGTVAQFIAVAEYILCEQDKPDILNMSFGAYNFDGDDLQAELCEKLVDAGITVVLSSGNDNLPTKYMSPAGAESAITVGAYNSDYGICNFSNYGEEIDVSAPGQKIYTACRGNKYGSMSGTSVAAPFVSSACAYALMNSPNSTPSEIKSEIINNSIYMGVDEEPYFGSGMLSITNIVNQSSISVTPDLEDSVYNEPQILNFENLPDDAQLIYTTDLSVPSKENGVVYSEPLVIDNDIHINYAVVGDTGYLTDIKSCNYSIQYLSDESDFSISLLGVITSYSSDKNNIVVPEKINGITPVEIGKNAFSNSSLISVVLPDTVKKINYGFENLTTLKHVVAKGVTTLTNAFAGCTNLRDEVMPNVSSASGSFSKCSMLHAIDFENSLTKFTNSDFEGTGLLSINAPNATHTLTGKSVFMSSTLISVNLPKMKKIGDYDFAYCKYLQEVNAPSAVTLGSHCFDGCTMLTEFDASNVETLSSEALSFCYIDTFDAPKIRTINLLDNYLTYSYIRVLKLPNLVGVLDPKCLDGSYVEEIYLDNITLMSAAFTASNHLKILYMPSCVNYIDTKTVPVLHGDTQSPLEVLWIPSCKELTYDCVGLKLLFAPSLTKLSLSNSAGAAVVVSEKLSTISVSTARNGSCKIYAPDESDAANYANDNDLQLVTNENAINIISYSGSSASFIIKNTTFDFSCFNYAGNIGYGIEYDYAQNSDLSTDAKCAVFDFVKDTNDKNLLADFAAFPDIDSKDNITFRAYMDVDGVRFYSPIISNKIDFTPCCSAHIKVSVIDEYEECFVYRCDECSTVYVVPADEVLLMWDIAFVNDFVTADSPREDYYLDVNSDGVVNVKDYAEILRVRQNM